MSGKSQTKASIRDRVIEFKRVDRDDVLPNEHNWRKHSEPQRAALRGLINEIGIAGAGLAYYSERNGGKLTLVDGHLRREEIPEQLPVIITDLNDIEADKLLASYDPLAAMATTDAQALDALLAGVSSEEDALSALLADLAEGAGSALFSDEEKEGARITKRRGEVIVKPVFTVSQVDLLEQAIRSTGESNRAEALIEICRSYLVAKGQFDVSAKSHAAA